MVASYANATFTITLSTTAPAYTFSASNSCDDPNITVRVGFTYTFTINTGGAPFEITTGSCATVVSASSGSISYTFTAADLSRALYWRSSWNNAVSGQFLVLDVAPALPANDGLINIATWYSTDCTALPQPKANATGYCDPLKHQAWFQCELQGAAVTPVLYTCADCSSAPTTCDLAPQQFWPPNGGPCTAAPGGVGSYIFTCESAPPTPLPPPPTSTPTPPSFTVCSGSPCWPNCPVTPSPTVSPSSTATSATGSTTASTTSTTTSGTTTTATTTGTTTQPTSTVTASSSGSTTSTVTIDAPYRAASALALAVALLSFLLL